MKLDRMQQAAAHSEAPLVAVVAGPGSGKTATLVEAIAAKARRDGPQSVVAITFTNAAADELKQRLLKLPPESGGPASRFGFIGTLHAFLLHLLRANHARAGLPCAPAVAPPEMAAELLQEVAGEMGVRIPKARMAELLARPDLIVGSPLVKGKQELAVVEVHRRLRRAGLLTFDGVLHYGLQVVKALPERVCRHLFVDEAQDSAAMDWAVYDAVQCDTKFVVGDTDQSIYGFRGADVASFTARLRPGSGWEVHVLERSYRCPYMVALAATNLIGNNAARVAKSVVADERDDPGLVMVQRCEDATTELHALYDFAYTSDPESCAVLCRSNRMAQEVAGFLRGHGVPVAHAKPAEMPEGWAAARALAAAYHSGTDFAWYEFLRLAVSKDHADRARTNAALAMAGLPGWLAKADPAFADPRFEAVSRLLPTEARRMALELKKAAGDDYAALTLRMAELESTERQPGVHVGTVHSAKGREWESVAVCGLEEDAFPKSGADIEEERRLMFVAVTRAKSRLRLTCALRRMQYRGPNVPPGPPQARTPSRFMAETRVRAG